MTPTAVTLFSGGGLKAVGTQNAGFELVGGVEYDPAIAAVYADNLGADITVGKVEETCPKPYEGIDALLASPVCTRMSIANARRGETEVDIIAAEGVCRWLRVTRPRIFVLENVTQYRASVSCKLIEACLSAQGYFFTANNVNSADFGVAQTRRRLIIRAMRDNMVPALPPAEKWAGWYAAIEDLIPGLPESKFANWQLKRLDPVAITMLIEGDAAGERPPTCRTSEEPSFTLKTSSGGRVHRAFLAHGTADNDRFPVCDTNSPAFCVTNTHGTHKAFLVSDQRSHNGDRCGVRDAAAPAMTIDTRPASKSRAWLEQGRVVSLVPRALARLQSMPDWYKLPASRTLASKIIGNGAPCLMMEKIMRQLWEAI